MPIVLCIYGIQKHARIDWHHYRSKCGPKDLLLLRTLSFSSDVLTTYDDQIFDCNSRHSKSMRARLHIRSRLFFSFLTSEHNRAYELYVSAIH